MAKLRLFFGSTVGKKMVVGVTGVGISLFVLVHMMENLLISVGAETYNRYANMLVTNPLIYLAEGGLLAFFLLHISFAIKLSLENRSARRGGYATAASTKAASFASRTMIYSGLLVLVFLILHLITFKYGPYYEVVYGGSAMRDLHRLVVEKFQQPFYVSLYVVALLILGLHLSHGISGVFQSLGIASSLSPGLRKLAWVFAIAVAGGFISQPLFIFFGGIR